MGRIAIVRKAAGLVAEALHPAAFELDRLVAFKEHVKRRVSTHRPLFPCLWHTVAGNGRCRGGNTDRLGRLHPELEHPLQYCAPIILCFYGRALQGHDRGHVRRPGNRDRQVPGEERTPSEARVPAEERVPGEERSLVLALVLDSPVLSASLPCCNDAASA
eukprot:762952-Hanusia_phi.AAC.4